MVAMRALLWLTIWRWIGGEKLAPEVGLGPQVLDFTNEIGGVFAEVKATRLLLGHY